VSDIVSFVMPVFNQSPYIREAVDSVLFQTYSPIELIIVDDGSADDTLDIVNSYKDDRIRIFSVDRLGPAGASNFGIARASGGYIALMGGDDVSDPRRAEIQVDFLNAKKLDIVFSLPRIIDANGAVLLDDPQSRLFKPIDNTASHHVFRQLFIGGNFLCAPSVLMRKEAVLRNGDFRADLWQLHDYFYWMSAAARGAKIGTVNFPIVSYRRHGENLSNEDEQDRSLGEQLDCLLEIMKIVDDSVLRKAFPDLLYTFSGVISAEEKMWALRAHPLAKELMAICFVDFCSANFGPPIEKRRNFEWVGRVARG
jgi:glycosyltransferase involved in cell wall biosynthesis